MNAGKHIIMYLFLINCVHSFLQFFLYCYYYICIYFIHIICPLYDPLKEITDNKLVKYIS